MSWVVRITVRPTGEAFGPHTGLLGRPHRRERVVGIGCPDTVEGREGADLLAGGQPLEERAGLKLHADAWQQRGVARPGALLEGAHGAGVRLPQPFWNLERSGLAGAVGPEQTEELTGPTSNETPSTACTFP
jgi:hypothetical protein